jgi:hypothetical protein
MPPYFDPPQPEICKLNNSGEWEMATQPLSGTGHSMFMNFARALNRKLGYPIGLIPRAVGGSSITEWINGGCHMESLKKEQMGEIKGVLWYQGCNEAAKNKYEDYASKFEDVVCQLRKKFHDDKLNVITFQLNRELSGDDENAGWTNIREVQRNIPNIIDNTYVIPTIDMRDMSDCIHNSSNSNMILGERAANLVLSVIYKVENECFAPNINSINITDKNQMKLTFDNVYGELFAFNVASEELPICVTDGLGENLIADYSIDKDVITLKTQRNISGKISVMAQYGQNPKNIIIDTRSRLPMLCFVKCVGYVIR